MPAARIATLTAAALAAAAEPVHAEPAGGKTWRLPSAAFVNQARFVPTEPAFSAYLGLDSFGKRASGRIRLSGGLKIAGLGAASDRLHLWGGATEGWANAAFAYERPLGGDRLRLFVGAETSRTKTVRDQWEEKHLVFGEAGLVATIAAREAFRLEGSFAATGFGETGERLGGAFLDQTGFGLKAGLVLDAAGEGWSAEVGGFLHGVRWSDGIAGGTVGHVAARGRLALSYQLGSDHLLRLEAATQWPLHGRAPDVYRITVSGPFAVRGYDGDLSGGDGGFLVRLEVERSVALSLPALGGFEMRPFLSADFGKPYDRLAGGMAGRDLLASVGLGARFRLGGRADAAMHLIKPLLDADGFRSDGAVRLEGALLLSF